MFSNTNVIYILCNILATIDAVTNQGKQFVVVFGDNGIFNSPPEHVHLIITTFLPSNVIVKVTSHPTVGSQVLVNTQFTVNSATVKKLTIDRYFRMVGNELSTKGILVEASDDITVHGFNRERYSTDTFLVIPVHGLGTEYFAISYFPPNSGAQLQVAAVYDNTSVSIQLSNNANAGTVVFEGISYAPGDSIILCLNKLDTLQLQTSGDLSGTYISSRKPIAVFSGNRKTKIGSNSNRDHMTEQLRPVSSWGKTFVLTSNPVTNIEDIYKFIASTLSTSLNFECTGMSSFTKNLASPGDFLDVEITNNINCFVTASQPVSVAQMLKNADPAMIIIPPVEQYLQSYHFANPSFDVSGYSLYVQVVIDQSKRTGLRLNGSPITMTSSVNSFSIGTVSVSSILNTLSHIDGSVEFGAFLYGKESFEMYSTAAGINLTTINLSNAALPTDVCSPPVMTSVELTTTTTPTTTTTTASTTAAATTTTTATTTSTATTTTTATTTSTAAATTKTTTTTEPTSTSSSTTTTTPTATTTTPTTSTAAATTTSEPTSTSSSTTTTPTVADSTTSEGVATTTEIPSTTSDAATSSTTQAYEPSTQCPSTQSQTTVHPAEYCDVYICFNFTDAGIPYLDKDLRIPKKDTTLYKRSLVSIQDNRTSARAIGLSGGGIIAVVVIAFILSDLPNLKAMLALMKKNLGLSSNKRRRSKA